MGDFRVRQVSNKEDRYRMYRYALRDIETFNKMWSEGMFSEGPIHIGAEQELCLVDGDLMPSTSALKLLDRIGDDHYTNELGLFNLEINCDPEKLEGSVFSKVEKDLLTLLNNGKLEASKMGEKILMTGILPTINGRHLEFDYMTPIPRYQSLSNMLYDIRGGNFEIYLQGVDELMVSIGSVLFEACNTSFQTHLQIKPSEFQDKYNWSQMISAPVLGVAVNSPLLFGRELWYESRIAVFKQSLDTRSSKNHLRKKLPRVYFGDRWLNGPPSKLWMNELMRFPLLLTSDDLQVSDEVLSQGDIPDLRGIRLHNGTTYTWNRLCYGPTSKPHVRIECRYLPAGPSAIDEMANFAFWVGLMNAMPDNWSEKCEKTDFRTVKENFIKAARYGLHTVMDWEGKPCDLKTLILDHLLPMADDGLVKSNVSDQDRKKYLSVIEKRVLKEQTGADWIIKNFRETKDKYGSAVARQELVSQMIAYQDMNVPVSEWDNSLRGKVVSRINKGDAELRVGHFMSADIFSINKESSLDLANAIMNENNIHHIPVEDHQGNLVGIVTDGMLKRKERDNPDLKYVYEIMNTNVVSAGREMPIPDLIALLRQFKLWGVPVMEKNKLVGIITVNDLIKAGYDEHKMKASLKI